MRLAEMDNHVTYRQQLQQDDGPVVLINQFTLAPEDTGRFLEVWAGDAAFMKQQPGFISTQLHQGTAGSATFINVAVWESARAWAGHSAHPTSRPASPATPPAPSPPRTSSRRSPSKASASPSWQRNRTLLVRRQTRHDAWQNRSLGAHADPPFGAPVPVGWLATEGAPERTFWRCQASECVTGTSGVYRHPALPRHHVHLPKRRNMRGNSAVVFTIEQALTRSGAVADRSGDLGLRQRQGAREPGSSTRRRAACPPGGCRPPGPHTSG